MYICACVCCDVCICVYTTCIRMCVCVVLVCMNVCVSHVLMYIYSDVYEYVPVFVCVCMNIYSTLASSIPTNIVESRYGYTHVQYLCALFFLTV